VVQSHKVWVYNSRMHELIFFIVVLWAGFCFAKVEIAIEGGHGWAENLPTWRLPPNNWASLLFFSGRPLTGYHVWMETFILSLLHISYVFEVPTWSIELQILAFFCFFSVVEDFLWFFLNPAFGLANFKPEKIWWHREHWWGIMPRDYYVLTMIGTVLYMVSLRFA